MHSEVVVVPLRDRAVVDALEGVIADVRRLVGEVRHGDEHLVGREHRAVDEVGVARVEAPLELLEVDAPVEVVEVEEMHVGLHGQRLRLHAQRVAERAVGVGKAEEEIRVLVGRGAGDDAPVAQQDVQLEHRVVHEALAVRGGFDADARERAAQRNGLELRHHRGHHALPQAGRDQSLVGHHALGFDPARLRIDREHVAESADVEPAARLRRPVAEEI
jgi:hypothetical protein